MGILTARLIEPAKPRAGIVERPGMFLVVAGTAERAEIRFEGNKQFLDMALQAVEGLVDDILAAEED